MVWLISAIIIVIIFIPLFYYKNKIFKTIDLRNSSNFGLLINQKNYINFVKHETGPYTIISIVVREKGAIRHFNKILENIDKKYKIKFKNKRKNYLLKFPDGDKMNIEKNQCTNFLNYKFFINAGSNN